MPAEPGDRGPLARVVGPIVEGSIIVLTGVEFDDDDGSVMGGVVEQLQAVAGHNRFVVIAGSGGDDVDLWTLDDNLGEKVRDALRRAGHAVRSA